MIDAVGVVVPARDEGARLPACLAHLRAAADAVPAPVGVVVVVVADDCVDDSEQVVRDHVGDDPRFSLTAGAWHEAGAARRAGAELALARLRPALPDRTWLAATDADSTVPPDWLTAQLALAAAGWHAVAGVVRLADADAGLRRRFRARYPLPPAGEHPYVHGANLGLRVDAYLAAGGWPVGASTGEDQRLWDQVRDGAFRTLATSQLWVTTSARLRGRAPDGFAARLEELL